MIKRRSGVVVVTLALCASCGGAQATSNTGSGDKAGPSSEEDKCIATANAPREKRANEPTSMLVKHIIVAFKGSKAAPEGVTRSRAQACLRAAKARDEIRAGGDFDKVATKYSDDQETLKHNIRRENVLPQFGDAAFELGVLQLSDVVETDDGFHVILRLE